ncbi:UDP-glucose 4-epimerase, partial [bacterium]
SVSDVFRQEKPDAVIHLAAQVSVPASVKDPVGDMEINIKGTIRILEACVKHGVKKVIFSSTGGAIYGAVENATEKSPPRPECPYGVAKLTCEHYLRNFYLWEGLPFTALRLANVYGPRQEPRGEAGVVAIFSHHIKESKRPKLFGYGKLIRDYVYVEDVVRAFILSMEKGDGEIINIGTGKKTTNGELWELMKKLSGTQLEPILEEKKKGEIDFYSLSIEKAKRVLGWEPQYSLEEGLKRTLAYFGVCTRVQ